MNARSANWFIRAVRKRVKTDPASAIRFDVTRAEKESCRAAGRTLVYGVPGKLGQWRFMLSQHPSHDQAENGVSRFAFMGPDAPRPIESIPCPFPKKMRKNPSPQVLSALNDAWMDYAQRFRDELRLERGPEFHVELNGANGPVCEVWRGEDWLAVRYMTLYPSEIAAELGRLTGLRFHVQRIEPMADVQSATNIRLRNQAAGAAVIRWARDGISDDAIVEKLSSYAGANPKQKLNTALENMIHRPNKDHELPYASTRSAYRRLKTIAEPYTPSAFYETLKR